MKEYLNKIKNKETLNSNDIDEIINEYTNYLNIDLDNISNIESLINHQSNLIDIEQYLIINHKHSNSKLQYLISIYDSRIQNQFKQFSKQERINIAQKYGISELYHYIDSLEDYYTIEEINYTLNKDLDQLVLELRLLNNLYLINYDGFNIYAYQERRNQKKKTTTK